VASLSFSPDAALTFRALRNDPQCKELLAALRDELTALADNPGSARSRERPFPRIRAWGITVRDRYSDWLILWQHAPDHPETIGILYIGSDPFA
jgi:plasmid stabilization system protein ParE